MNNTNQSDLSNVGTNDDLTQLEEQLLAEENEIAPHPETQRRNALNIQEMAEIQQTADELMHGSFEQLSQKYSLKELSDIVAANRPVSNTNVIDYIMLLRQLFIIDFVLPQKMNTITNKKKNDLVQYIASLNTQVPLEEINLKIKTIDPNFNLPNNFSLPNHQARAAEIVLGINNLKNIIADGIAETYLTDVMHLLRLSPDKFDSLSNQLIVISDKLEQEYNRLQQNQDVNSEVLNEAINLINQTGRSPLAIEDLRQDKNLGDITDLILQITTAIRAVNNIKAKNIDSNITNEFALQEIKSYILEQMDL